LRCLKSKLTARVKAGNILNFGVIMKIANKVLFSNNGVFDVENALVFGVSVKDNDNAIGHFGTGFKYAAAIILRMGGKIKVETSGGEVYEFTKEVVNVRGVDFDYVMVNGKRTGFTTRLGINWEPWQAYRELSCNATDEGGVITFEKQDDYDTVITVECAQIVKAHHERDKHFISGEMIGTYCGVEVYDKPSDSVYYQGVEVATLQKTSKYSYNIKSYIELTEDRTAKYEHQIRFKIQQCMQMSDDDRYIDEILEQDGEFYEKSLGFDKDWSASEKFVEQAIKKSNTGKGVSDSVNKIIQKHIDRHGEWPLFELTKIQSMQYEKACEFLLKSGVDISDYRVNFVKGLGQCTYGRAHKGEIFISEIPFNLGTKQLASTLLEEWVHLNTGCADFDRTMQNWLFDKVMSLCEVINGEPV